MSAATLMPLRPGEQVSSPDDRTPQWPINPSEDTDARGEVINPINLTL
jgi:hypothetical protein